MQIELNKQLARAVGRVDKAEVALKQTAEAVQSKCSHDAVWWERWRSGEFFGPFKSRRICMHCRLEEEANGLGNDDYHFKRLAHPRLREEVQNVVQYRIM